MVGRYLHAIAQIFMLPSESSVSDKVTDIIPIDQTQGLPGFDKKAKLIMMMRRKVELDFKKDLHYAGLLATHSPQGTRRPP